MNSLGTLLRHLHTRQQNWMDYTLPWQNVNRSAALPVAVAAALPVAVVAALPVAVVAALPVAVVVAQRQESCITVLTPG